jgi:transcriptional regulator with XRE-family HTH domain
VVLPTHAVKHAIGGCAMRHSGIVFNSDCEFTIRLIRWMMETRDLTYEDIAERAGLSPSIVGDIVERRQRRQRYNDAIRKAAEDTLNRVYDPPIDFDKARNSLGNRRKRQHA